MMTSAGLVRASVLLTAQTCIAANLQELRTRGWVGPAAALVTLMVKRSVPTPGWYRTSAYYL